MKNQYLILLPIVFLLSACATNKRSHTNLKLPEPVPPEVLEVYSCHFEQSVFEGVLPCYGNDCTDAGAPLTTLKFDKAHRIFKYLESENGKRDTLQGTWSINNNCRIQIEYANNKIEYFKYHFEQQKIELLNAQQQSFSGALNKHYFISKVK